MPYRPLQNFLHLLRIQSFFQPLSRKYSLAVVLATHSSSALNLLNLAATRSSTALVPAYLLVRTAIARLNFKVGSKAMGEVRFLQYGVAAFRGIVWPQSPSL